MTVELDDKALSVLLAALQALDDKWGAEKAAAADPDEVADLTNDLLYAQSLSAYFEDRLSEDAAGPPARAAAA